jgi:hypothetical protein
MYTHDLDGELLLLLCSTTPAVTTTLQATLHRLGSNAGVYSDDKSILLRKM